MDPSSRTSTSMKARNAHHGARGGMRRACGNGEGFVLTTVLLARGCVGRCLHFVMLDAAANGCLLAFCQLQTDALHRPPVHNPKLRNGPVAGEAFTGGCDVS